MRRFFILLIYILSTNSVYSQWINSKVDTVTNDFRNDYATSPNSIFIDHQSIVHIAWQKLMDKSNPNSWRVYYSKKVFGEWQIPLLLSDSLKSCGYPSIVVSKYTNKVYVSYLLSYDLQRSETMLTVINGNSLEHVNISNDSLQNRNPTISIDNKDYVHIAWLGMDSLFNDKIQYSNNKSGKWDNTTLKDNFLGDNYFAVPSLAISSVNQINIIYLSKINGQSRNVLASLSDSMGSKWKFELLPTSINGSGILKCGPKDELHYVYNFRKGFQEQLQIFHTFNEMSPKKWSPPKVINEDLDGVCSGVFVDQQNFVHLSIDSLSKAFKMGKLYYATNNQNHWAFYPITIDGKSFQSCFAVDKTNRGHIIASNKEFFEQTELIHFQSMNKLIEIDKTLYEIEDYVLTQNFPNPFNQSTKCVFKLPKTQTVALTIYDNLGRIILYQRKVMVEGTHILTFNFDKFSSGVFFYKIETSEFSNIRKMIHLK